LNCGTTGEAEPRDTGTQVLVPHHRYRRKP
jgi:hypothetical protein